MANSGVANFDQDLIRSGRGNRNLSEFQRPPALSATWAHCNFGMDILDGRTGLILICTYTSNLGITKDEGLVRQEGTGRIFPFIEHHGNSIPATSARM